LAWETTVALLRQIEECFAASVPPAV